MTDKKPHEWAYHSGWKTIVCLSLALSEIVLDWNMSLTRVCVFFEARMMIDWYLWI